jgi:outer membrane protein TolC
VLFLITLLIYVNVNGQKIDYNTIILPPNVSDLEFPEKLVRLAWQNNPSVSILSAELDKSLLDVKYTQFTWLNNIRITGNLNEFNINTSNSALDGSMFFPRYNISATVSLGDFVLTPNRTKLMKENVNISNESINLRKLELRAEVLKRYQTFINYKEIYDIRVQMVEDAFSDYKLKEISFGKGEIPLGEYTISLERYNQHKISKILAERDVVNARIELEELIGVKISDVR